MDKKTLIAVGVGALILYLLTSESNAQPLTVPSNDGGPGPNPQVYEASEDEVRQLPPSEPSGSFGRTSDPNFGTGSGMRGTRALSADDVPGYLSNPDIAYLYGDR